MTKAQSPEKTCNKCGETKPRSEFYKWRGACRTCFQKQSITTYYRRVEADPGYNARRAKEPKRAAISLAHNKMLKQRHPERYWARMAFNLAVRSGKIIRQPCSKCGKPRAHGHHADYSKPLDVEWLCARCHGREHRKYESL